MLSRWITLVLFQVLAGASIASAAESGFGLADFLISSPDCFALEAPISFFAFGSYFSEKDILMGRIPGQTAKFGYSKLAPGEIPDFPGVRIRYDSDAMKIRIQVASAADHPMRGTIELTKEMIDRIRGETSGPACVSGIAIDAHLTQTQGSQVVATVAGGKVFLYLNGSDRVVAIPAAAVSTRSQKESVSPSIGSGAASVLSSSPVQ